MTMILQYGFLILVAILLPFAIVRQARTAVRHPERQARGDVAALLALMFLGQSGSLLRDWVLERYGVVSVAYLLCNLALLGVVGAALFYLNRLYLAYRRSKEAVGGRPPGTPPSVGTPEPLKDRTPKP